MKMLIKRGTTSKTVRVFVQDSSQTNGAGLAGLTSSSAGLSAYYCRDGDSSSTAIALVAGTVGTYTNSGSAGTGGGFVAVDGTNMPGLYEVSLPDASLAGTGYGVIVYMKGAVNMAPCLAEIELSAFDPQSATNLGLSNLDASVSSRGTFSGGAVASVTGDVGGNVVGNVNGNITGNVTGNITGNVIGTIGSISAGGITSASLAAGALVTQAVASVAGSVGGDVEGKLLGGGASTITGVGAQVAGNTSVDVTEIGGTPVTLVGGLLSVNAANIVTGSGDTSVSESYVSAGCPAGVLYYKTSAGVGIAGATVTAFLTSDYNARPRIGTVRGQITTRDDGGWVAPLLLNKGLSYTIVFQLPGFQGPDAVTVTI